MSAPSFLGVGEVVADGMETRYDCPFCIARGKSADTDGHLYVHSCGHGHCPTCLLKNRDGNGLYLCHRCGATGSFAGADQSRDDPGAVSRFNKVVAGFLEGEAPKPTEVNLPSEFVPLDKYSGAWGYLVGRGLTPEDIEFYGLGVGRGKLRNRIIIPTRKEDGEVVFWVARLYTGTSRLKYVNPPGNARSNCLFNLDRAVSYGWVIVTEGVFSAMAAGRNAVASFGKMVSDTQVALLADAYRRHRLSCIVAALDGDARQENMSLARRLHSQGCTVFVVDLPRDQDPADMGRAEFGKLVAGAYLYDPLDILRRRLEEQ